MPNALVNRVGQSGGPATASMQNGARRSALGVVVGLDYGSVQASIQEPHGPVLLGPRRKSAGAMAPGRKARLAVVEGACHRQPCRPQGVEKVPHRLGSAHLAWVGASATAGTWACPWWAGDPRHWQDAEEAPGTVMRPHVG